MFCLCEILLKLELHSFSPQVDLQLSNTGNGELLFLTPINSALFLMLLPLWELVSHLVENQQQFQPPDSIVLTVGPISFGLKAPPFCPDTPEVSSLLTGPQRWDDSSTICCTQQPKPNLSVTFSFFLWRNKNYGLVVKLGQRSEKAVVSNSNSSPGDHDCPQHISQESACFCWWKKIVTWQWQKSGNNKNLLFWNTIQSCFYNLVFDCINVIFTVLKEKVFSVIAVLTKCKDSLKLSSIMPHYSACYYLYIFRISQDK